MLTLGNSREPGTSRKMGVGTQAQREDRANGVQVLRHDLGVSTDLW